MIEPVLANYRLFAVVSYHVTSSHYLFNVFVNLHCTVVILVSENELVLRFSRACNDYNLWVPEDVSSLYWYE